MSTTKREFRTFAATSSRKTQAEVKAMLAPPAPVRAAAATVPSPSPDALADALKAVSTTSVAQTMRPTPVKGSGK